jgi:WD40-like Beta Propeller Repeat
MFRLLPRRITLLPVLPLLALSLLSCGDDVTGSAPDAAPRGHAFQDAVWSTPVNAGPAINSPANEQNAMLSKDELSLYFSSNRAGSLDIWIARRASTDAPWEPAVRALPGINTAVADFAPNLSIDGHLLFFASNRDGNIDIYVAHRTDTADDFAWDAPVRLGADVNTAGDELAPFYLQNAEDGPGNLYFNRSAPGQSTQGDIYYAPVDRDGQPRGASVLVAELSDPVGNDAAITVRKDGREVFLWSTRAGSAGGFDIWTSTRRSVHDPWAAPVNVGAPINTGGVEVTPSLSFDGRTLVFGSDRGLQGHRDIWFSTRAP